MHDFKTLEDTLYFILRNLRLSKVDRSFLSNLTELIKRNNFITTNQDQLFRKIIVKYDKQFSKLKINSKDLLALPYKRPLVASVPSKAEIAITDDIIRFTSPYKTDFIRSLRGETIPKIHWNKEKGTWEMPLTLFSLRELYDLAKKSFNTIEMCDQTQQIINSIGEYADSKFWDPTLVYNQQLLIYAANQSLMQAIEHIPLELNCRTMANLVGFGIKIDQSVIDALVKIEPEDKVRFAVNYVAEIDFDLQPNVAVWLKEFGCDAVYFNENQRIARLIGPKHRIEIKNHGMKIVVDESRLKDFKNPVIIVPMHDYMHVDSSNIFKRIKWLNSKPINIK